MRPLRKVDKKHGIKRRLQMANARVLPDVLLRRTTGVLVVQFAA